MQPKPAPALFAPGDILYSQAALDAMHRAGVTAVALICHHITGDWDDDESLAAANRAALDSDNDWPLVSRYRLTTDIEIVITTMYVHTPSLRWTDICLADEVIEDEPTEDTDEFDLPAEAALTMAELLAEEA